MVDTFLALAVLCLLFCAFWVVVIRNAKPLSGITIFLLAATVGFLIRALVLVWNPDLAVGGANRHPQLKYDLPTLAWMAAVFCIAALAASRWVAVQLPPARSRNRDTLGGPAIEPWIPVTACSIASLLTSTAYIVLIRSTLRAASTAEAIDLLTQRSLTITAGTGAVSVLVEVSLLLAGAAVYAYRCRRPGLPAGGLAAFAAVMSIAIRAASGSRGGLLQALFVIGVCFLGTVGRWRGNLMRMLGLAAVVVTILYVGVERRYAAQQGEVAFRRGVDVESALAETTGSTASLDGLSLARRYVADEGLRAKAIPAGVAANLVPVGVWPEKPPTNGVLIRRHFWGDALTGIPAGAAGEGYLTGGVTGVIAAGIFLGALIALAESWLTAALAHRRAVDVAAVSMIVYQLAGNAIRSGMESAIARSILVLCIFLAIKAVSNFFLIGHQQAAYRTAWHPQKTIWLRRMHHR